VVGQFDALSRDLDKCFNINVLSDSLVEREESFTVSLHLITNLSPSLADRITVNQNQMTVNIIDTSMLIKDRMRSYHSDVITASASTYPCVIRAT
jgi:hypothetical protein